MTLIDRTAPDEAAPTAPPQWRPRLYAGLAVARAGAGRWARRLPRRAWGGLFTLGVWTVWFLCTCDRSAPGRIGEALGALDRGVGRRLLALAVSGRWDRPLVRLHDFDPPILATIGAVTWLIGVPALVGVDVWTPALVSPALSYLAVIVASREYAKTRRGRLRGQYGSDGWATYWDLQRAMTRHAVRMAAVQTRPSVEAAVRGTWTDRPAARFVARLPVTECGTWVGHTAVGPWRPIGLYVPHRDVVGVIAPPQTGKTAWLGHAIIDHPGAVVSTSTKPDLFSYTAELRRLVSVSGDVELFNPEGLGGHPSTFAWSPLAGCGISYVAAERAGAMVGATSAAGGEDGTFWLDSASKVLRCFLLAAALDDRTMVDVAAWISSHQLAVTALDILESPRYRLRVPQGWALELAQVISTSATKTRESIFLTLAQSVAFMSDPEVAALCAPADGAPVFDVEAFLRDRGTLYLIGSERQHATIAPLLAALTTHVFEEAKRVAARSNGKGRLDPPLLLALDEAALITPVALDRWTADAGGRGIHIIWSVQSPSQLEQRWGARGRDTIFNNTTAKLVFGGLTVVDDLESISRLCGQVDEPPTGEDKRPVKRPLLSVDQLRELPQWHALLLHRNTRATLVRVSPVWDRRDVRHIDPSEPTSRIEDRVARRRIGDHHNNPGEAAA